MGLFPGTPEEHAAIAAEVDRIFTAIRAACVLLMIGYGFCAYECFTNAYGSNNA